MNKGESFPKLSVRRPGGEGGPGRWGGGTSESDKAYFGTKAVLINFLITNTGHGREKMVRRRKIKGAK